MTRYRSLLGTVLMTALVAGSGAFAQQTAGDQNVISYQGMLTSHDGTPVPDGEYQITVTLYGDENGAERIWHDTYRTPVQGGIFSIYLGSGDIPLPAPGQMDRGLWVGTQISGGDEMRPLTRLSATPYAINVRDKAITTSKLADGAVTREKVNMDYVEGITVNGRKIEGKGTTLNIQGSRDINVTYDEATRSVVIGSASAPGSKGDTFDGDEGRDLQATALDAWTMRGEGISVLSGNPVTAIATDYIGTNAPGNIPFNIRVNGQPAMTYQPNGTNTPSIIGGSGSNGAPGNGLGNTIAGGGSGVAPATTANTIQGLLYNSVGGGEGNQIRNVNSDYGTIDGGRTNTIGSATIGVDNAAIGGGTNNQVLGGSGVIGGGQFNIVNPGGFGGTIAGGRSNSVSAGLGAVGGGESNSANSDWDVVGGGIGNTVTGPASGIFGGEANYVEQDHSVIAGGWENRIIGPSNFIGGGSRNIIDNTSNAIIAGGIENRVLGNGSGIVTGSSNYVENEHSVIATGVGNQIYGGFSFIGAGDDNVINYDYYDVIGGGRGNRITGSFNIIGNGLINLIEGEYSAILTGRENQIYGPSNIIGSGDNNIIKTEYSAIGGGISNRIYGGLSFIGGGEGNSVDGDRAAVAGGSGNAALASSSFIGGGIGNRTSSGATAGAIPGGDNLLVQSYGQTAVGVFNAPRGSVPFRFGGLPRGNDPIFMVGNGIAPARSNAFEVSYNGHSTVYHTNGQGTAAITGSTYTDNVTYAWGDIGWNGATLIRNGDFGVNSITRLGAGWYRVRMTLTTPGGAVANLSTASVTANVSTNAPPGGMFARCRYVTVSRLNGTSEFDIFITEQRINAGTMTLDCVNVDDSFMFRVTGRP